jgi:hypothetical protein
MSIFCKDKYFVSGCPQEGAKIRLYVLSNTEAKNKSLQDFASGCPQEKAGLGLNVRRL